MTFFAIAQARRALRSRPFRSAVLGAGLLLRNSHGLGRGCERAGRSPKNFPTNKIFLPKIPGLGAEVFPMINHFHSVEPAAFSDQKATGLRVGRFFCQEDFPSRRKRISVPSCFFLSGSKLVLAIGLTTLGAGCGRDPKPVTAASVPTPSPAATAFKSADCRSCHEEIFKAWSASDHALAHRAVDPKSDADAFATPRDVSLHGVDYTLAWKDGRPAFSEKRGTQPADHYVADFALGYKPLRQYIVPAGNGRYQAAELTFDPAKKEWFNVFGDERRHPGEWGYWRGRGMNWNSMCAHCHLTDYKKNYDATTDVYATTWREHGVGCSQCHGDLPASHVDPQRKPNATPRVVTADVLKRAQETCAPCHARNELLTGRLVPGAPYADHYRLTLPTEASVFYPDGQMRDEDFNYTGFLTSRMGGKSGVTCLDCHDPHSGRTKLPADNNMLCLQCHGPSPRNNAPIIDPVAHSHHGADSTGNRCVTCHMPTTVYMQRDPRHDHGFLKPDPLLTKELGIPNACNRCHTDQTVDWAIAHADAWYGPKLQSRQRERARAVAAGQAGTPAGLDRLLALIGDEDVPAWRATLLQVTRNYAAGEPRVLAVAREAIKHADPLVRSAGAQVLASAPGQAAALRPLLNDATRLVRLDAAWPLSTELPENSPARRELDAYLAVSADQPAGRMRIGQDLFNRGRATEAEAHLRKAVEWDPNSPGILDALGVVLNEVGKTTEAAAMLWRAAQLNPSDAGAAFNAALAFAGARKLPDAEFALREALRRNPRHDRASYNLGLLLAQTGRAVEAIAALEAAEKNAPNVADYPYARATILWQRGERTAAMTAAQRALQIDPTHAEARALLGQR
ncbi:MAG: tetratricopeptide repeat protein [Opitutus sp.]|nr:tetratricopeptide repeat protein [Opitutus sp.]